MDNLHESKEIDIELKKDSGQVKAVFSVFNSLDSDGDVVVPGAVKSGFKNDKVPMVWSHNWDKPIGKGTIKQTDNEALFEGEFFMDTESGKEAYNLVKNMSDMQQWSFGYRVNDAEVSEFTHDGEEVDARYLKDLTVFEVSPVLVGANQDTYTLAIKSNKEALKEIAEVAEVKDVLTTESMNQPDPAEKPAEEVVNEKYAACNHEKDGSCAKEGKTMKDTEVKEQDVEKVTFSQQVKEVLAALDDLMTRATAIAMLRAKDGRKIGEAATRALRSVQEDLTDAWTELDEFINEVGTEEVVEESEEVEVPAEETAEEVVEEEVTEEEVAETPVEVEEEVIESAPVEEVTETPVEVEEEVVESEEVSEEATEEVVEEVENETDDDFDALWLEGQQLIAESIDAELSIDAEINE